MGQRGTSFRIFVTYSGFDESKLKRVKKVSARKPHEETFDPIDGKSQVVWNFKKRGAAERLRMRLLDYLGGVKEWKDRFSVSKVVDDGF